MIHLYHLEKFALMREAITRLSAEDTQMVCSGNSNDSAIFEHDLIACNVDVLLLDMDLETNYYQPLTDCFNLCTQLQSEHPLIRIVLHSPYNHSGWLNKFINLGVTGFVSKNSIYGRVSEAIHAVHAGELFVCPVIADQFTNFSQFLADRTVPLKSAYSAFSPREMEVLDLLSRGFSTKHIAAQLFIAEKTVETHRKNLINKAGAKNTAELVRFVSIRGLLIP